MGRRLLAVVVLGAVLAVLGLAAAYVRLELAEPEPFADRAVAALRSDEVRSVIAEQVAVELVERGSPELVASRPLVLSAVEAVLQTEAFSDVLRRAAITAHGVLLAGDRDAVVELEDAAGLLRPALEPVSPEIARQVPADVRPQVAEVRRTDVATWLVRLAEGVGPAAFLLLAAAGALLGGAVWRAPGRRGALAVTGGALAVAAAAGLVAMTGLREQAVGGAGAAGVLAPDEARAAAGAAWEALAGDLERWLVLLGTAGVALAAGAVLAEARVDRAHALRRVADAVAGGRLPPAARLGRGLGLAALGALVAVGAEPVATAALAVLGGALVLLGLAELASVAGRRRSHAAGAGGPPGRAGRPARRTVLVSGGLALLVAGGALAAVLARDDDGPDPPAAEEVLACNGLPELCDRRLDEVVLPGTHNSFSAADRPGWFFANQTRPIPQQLRDGIRLLMLDPHLGVVDARGRVRTDLRAEGTDRNRVARQLGVEAVQVAERLAGRLGLVPADGEQRIFLCHSLCELGAEGLGAALDDLRGFLERNPAEVVVLFLESSVEPQEVEGAFEDADLLPYLATLRRGAPLPTLREMIASGRRVVVLDQDDGGPAPWHHPAFVLLQDTRIAGLDAAPTACAPGRGTPESPLLLMNHWVDRFPPPPQDNAEVGTRETILARARRCARRLGRPPNLIAVDFYDRGAVVAAARELNLRR